MEKINGDPVANHFVSSTLTPFSPYPCCTSSASVSNMTRDTLEQLICIFLFVQKVQFQTYKCHLCQYVKSVAVATTREQIKRGCALDVETACNYI